MTEIPPPTIDPQAASRWQRRGVGESPWLHEEVARRMQQRLDWIKVRPASWINWQALSGGVQAHGLLLQRYPKARCTVLEYGADNLTRAAQVLLPARWQPQAWLQPRARVLAQIEQPAQMLWCNMQLHMAHQPQALMQQWHQALQVDGFLMFSCLGPDTLMEMRALYRALGWPQPCHAFTDLHDWGDMLLAAGFAEPVMDMERITLTFETPERLLLELRGLGHNLQPDRFAGLRGRGWHRQLLSALGQQPLQLTFEVIYGHAFKPAARLAVGAHSAISLDQMRTALKLGARGRHA
jgi:malonyl-CoA O-methyltransferase